MLSKNKFEETIEEIYGNEENVKLSNDIYKNIEEEKEDAEDFYAVECPECQAGFLVKEDEKEVKCPSCEMEFESSKEENKNKNNKGD